MTRTALRHTLSALAAAALVSAFAAGPASAQKANPIIWLSYDQAVEPGQSKTPKDLATRKHSGATSNYPPVYLNRTRQRELLSLP